MINIVDPSKCCGCTACESICNHDAIVMKPDSLGFLYPAIDRSKCVECGLCEKVCSFNDNYDTSLNFLQPVAYGARHKDINEVLQSRSGAIFVAISDYVLSMGGVIYGVGFVDHFTVAHKRAVSKKERDEFRGSKYVQSDLRGIFKQVKVDLKAGIKVLFVGTGCQTSGLNSYIGPKLRENLILIDIVCHGVASPFYWRDYVNYLENKYGNLVKVDFRDKKKYGWSSHHESFSFSNGHIEYPQKSFYESILFRKSCFNCHFCNTLRPSDITIADFWGWEKQNASANADNLGLSLVLINTQTGIYIWNQIKKDIDFFEAKPYAYLQPNLQNPTKLHNKRLTFEYDYKKKGFEYVYNHTYDERPLYKKILSKVYFVLRKLKLKYK
jgi:coenzyme F420-reducing hydrogenase beta subunit